MPVSMIASFTPLPVLPYASHAVPEPMNGTDSVLSSVFGVSVWTALTPGRLVRAATFDDWIRTRTPL